MNWFSRWMKAPSEARGEEQGALRPAIFGENRNEVRSKAEIRYPHFKLLATDQLHFGRGDELERTRAKLRDAFTPSQPVSDISMFAGRGAILTRLICAIEDQQLHAIIYGERGIGKTSLLRVLSRLADDAKYIVCYTSCGEGTSFSDMIRSMAQSIPLLFHAGYDPAESEIERGRTMADLLPPGEVTPHQVSELFAQLSATRVLIILDEFDRSPRGAFRRTMAELMKNLSDRSTRVQVVVAGVADNLSELIEHIPSIRRNILGLQVPNMTLGEVSQLIELGSGSCGLQYRQDAIDLVAHVSLGLPYIASLLSQHAGIAALDRKATSVERADVAQALDVAVEETRQRLSERSVRLIQRVQEQGGCAALVKLADDALHHAGVIELKPNQAELATAIEKGLEAQLLTQTKDEIGERFRFVEEGLPVYLWMQSVNDSLKGGQPVSLAQGR